MQTKILDVVVIGGGPAGAAAAYTLARQGHHVAVVDKNTFPRDKLCGGLVTLRSKKIFETVFGHAWDDSLFLASHDVDFCQEGQPIASINGYSTLFFTMRYDFDNYLLRLAERAGAEILLGRRIRTLNVEQKHIEFDDHLLRFKYLIGADGVNSLVSRTLNGSVFDPSTIGFGLEVEVPRDPVPGQRLAPQIHFDVVKWGYGWVFPKFSTFTVGIGGLHEENPDMKERLALFLKLVKFNRPNLKVKGHFIPFGDYRRQPGKDNILLCGDAAGLVDPITGEGIAYAMQSGHAAALSVADSIATAGRTNAYPLYAPRFALISKSIRQAALARNLIFPAFCKRLFLWALPDASTIQRGYLDVLAGNHDYDALPSLLALQTYKGFRKGFRYLVGRPV